MFTCPISSFTCIENFLLFIFSIVSVLLFGYGFRQIYYDKNNILDSLNKKLYLLATMQVMFLALYFSIFGNSFTLSTIRSLRLVSEIIIAMMTLYTLVEKEKHKFYYNIMQGCLLGTFCIWFYSALLN